MLLDRRHSTSHKVIEDLMLIKGNDKNWSPNERKEIIESALESYLAKRRYKQADSELDHNNKPPEMVRVLDPSISDSYSDSI